MKRPQIKICGLTTPADALHCAEQGADAIGLVFYEKSPRNVTPAQAGDIVRALPDTTIPVGVFVNESFDYIMERVEKCLLKAVQLHGNETPEMGRRLRDRGVHVIKALYLKGEPNVSRASSYTGCSLLVECSKGVLPGGNALSWNWGDAKEIGEDNPIIIAGGLTPENVTEALESGQPDAVDVSSGVEAEPGKKDLSKIDAFIHAVMNFTYEKNRNIRSVF